VSTVMNVPLEQMDLSLSRLRQLPKSEIEAMKRSLEAKGQLSPLVAGKYEGRLMVLDGFVRYLAAQRLGWSELKVEVVETTPVQMKGQMYVRNQARGFVLYEECRLVRELSEQDGLNQVEIGELLERHKSWVSRRLSLVAQLSESLWEEAALGGLGSGSLTTLAQLQPRNQEEAWAVIKREELKPAESKLFVDLYRKAKDPEARSYLLEHPREALKMARGKKGMETAEVRLGAAGQKVLGLLNSLRVLGLKLSRQLREGVEELEPEGRDVLNQALERADGDCVGALLEMKEFLTKTGRSRCNEAKSHQEDRDGTQTEDREQTQLEPPEEAGTPTSAGEGRGDLHAGGDDTRDGARVGPAPPHGSQSAVRTGEVAPERATSTEPERPGWQERYSRQEDRDGTQTPDYDGEGTPTAPGEGAQQLQGGGDDTGDGTDVGDECQHSAQSAAQSGHVEGGCAVPQTSQQAGSLSCADPDAGPTGEVERDSGIRGDSGTGVHRRLFDPQGLRPADSPSKHKESDDLPGAPAGRRRTDGLVALHGGVGGVSDVSYVHSLYSFRSAGGASSAWLSMNSSRPCWRSMTKHLPGWEAFR